jgi:hypothetical protein
MIFFVSNSIAIDEVVELELLRGCLMECRGVLPLS